MKTIKEKKRNTAVPGEPMTDVEFINFIKEGEKGPFIPYNEFKRKFDTWRNQLGK
jgi:hypothetical protein